VFIILKQKHGDRRVNVFKFTKAGIIPVKQRTQKNRRHLRCGENSACQQLLSVFKFLSVYRRLISIIYESCKNN